MRVAVDWDSTCVDTEGEWLPGALDALRWLRKSKHKVIIHSCRANWVTGLQEIEAKLDKHCLPFKVIPKPDADLYVDDKALRFTRWPDVVKAVRNAS